LFPVIQVLRGVPKNTSPACPTEINRNAQVSATRSRGELAMVLGMRRAVAKLQRHQWGIWELRTLLLDLRFGGLVGGRQESRFRHLGSNDVQSIPYRVIRDAMRGLAVTPEDVLVDVGCGLGRVINWWLNLGLANRMIGIELDPDVAQRTRTRLAPFRNVS